MSFQNRKALGEKLYPEVFAIFAKVIGREATLQEDMCKSIDLVLPGAGLSVRIRRPEFLQYRSDITIRLNENNDGHHELYKLKHPPAAGLKADYLFYGFAVDDECTQLGHWTIYDLDVFARSDAPYTEKYTGKGERFAVFRVQDFPLEFKIAEGYSNDITDGRT